MQRSLSNNPVMATNASSIAATRPDSSSVLISISSSSPVSSVILSPAFTPASPPPSGGARVSQEQATVAVPGRDHTANLISINARSPHSTTQHPYQQHQTSTAATRDIFNSDRDGHDPEVDDRIHFRLLNNIFFSSSTRHAGHDRDGSVSPNTAATISHSGFGSRATDRRHAIDFQNISTSGENDTHMTDAMEDGIEYGLHSPTSISSDLLADRSDDFQSAVLRTRSNRPDPLWEDMSGNNNFDDNDPDDDEDDDGIDQVIESRRRHDARAYAMDMDIPASLSFSNTTIPFHAALSPRSAAALNNALTGGHFAESSISSDLTALSQQGPSDDYGSNPYIRRVPSSYPSRTITEHRPPMISPAGVRLDSMNHYSSELHDDASTSRPTPGSVSMQFNRINLDYNSHRGCGENAPVSNIETRGDVWPLKFEMYYADGGEFNAAHSVENVLKNDSSVYWRSTNINICLKLAEPRQTFVLTQFKAKAPTTGFTAPCKEGLIFISHEPIPLEKTAFFDNMTRERYNEYMEDIHHGAAFKQLLQSHGAGADSIVPAAFFQVDGPDETCTLDFTPNRY
ncbi:hypothetical protein BGZ98_003426 [Dissophora globulifera]|nr:hypothetical protein BGZ98_003426 [Dissophora globulifera]